MSAEEKLSQQNLSGLADFDLSGDGGVNVEGDYSELEKLNGGSSNIEIDLEKESEPKGEEENEEGEETEEEKLAREEKEKAEKEKEGEEEEEEEEVPSDFKSALKAFQEEQGWEFDIEGETSEEQLNSFINNSTEVQANKMIEEIFGADDTLQKHFEFIRSGGKKEDFWKVFSRDKDYSNIEVQEDNTAIQKELIRDNLTKQGLSPEEVSETVEDFEQKELLYKQSKIALKQLATEQENKEKQAIEQQKLAKKQQEEEMRNTHAQASKLILEEGKLMDFNIPKNKREEFYHFLHTPDKEGMTPYQRKMTELGLEGELAMAYAIMNDFNISQEVEKKAKTTIAKGLESQFKANSGTPGSKKTKSVPGLEGLQDL